MDRQIDMKQGRTMKSKTERHVSVDKETLRKQKNKLRWSESGSEIYRPSDRRLSANLVLIFADRGYRVVSATYL
jgi:hypothetical protein